MALQNSALVAFNRGRVDIKALARTDLKRLALSAEIQKNFMPRSLGSMMLRPGLQYIGTTDDNNQAVFIPFIYANDDVALLELTNLKMRVWLSESVITRASVSSAVTNGTFDSNLNNWTDADESGATSQWATGGYMSLAGTKFNSAIRRQEVTVGGSDQNVEHALNISIFKGNVTLRVGSGAGGEQYIADTVLRPGFHSLAFTPTGNFHIQFANKTQYAAYVDSVAVASSGDMEITTPWTTADLDLVRWAQSGDVVFCAADGYQQRRIERQGTRSWSLVKYETQDGPFRVINTSTTTLTPSGQTGDITLTASSSIFKSTNVGSLYEIASVGQKVTASVTGAGQFTSSIRVVGVDNSRVFTIDISGTWSATVTLQRSIAEEGNWTDVTTYTTNQSAVSFDDALDNQIVYYRIGVDTGDYTSGTAVCTLTYSGGSITGVVRATGFTSSTVVDAAVLSDLGQTAASTEWSESVWSDRRGWPSSVDLYEGRLWWAGKDKIIGSVSDAFESFDDETEGDSGPINRSIGQGPVDDIRWLAGRQRLLIGGEGAEHSARSSSFDEPLTPTNFSVKEASNQGSANVAAVKVDARVLYVQKSGFRLFELAFNPDIYDYASNDLSKIVPDIGDPGFVKLVVQRQPDTRIHGIRSDGTVAVLLFIPSEELLCWVDVEIGGSGVVEDAVVLPGTEEDAVYYVVKRTINSSTKRYLEKWAMESQCEGSTLNRQADSFKVISQAASATISGLDHLEGQSVVVWSSGKCLDDASGNIATFTVSSGSITCTDGGSSHSVTSAIVGLPYTGTYKSTKLAYAAQLGTALIMNKRVVDIGFVLVNTHHKGLEFGANFTTMDNLPQVIDGATVATDTVHSTLDLSKVTFPGGISNDTRLCLRASAPRPVTVCAAILGMATDDDAP
jgi:hypothetical protein